MSSKKSIQLIEGKFTPEKAAELIYNLIDKKVDFHQLQLFSDKIRFNGEDEHSKRRIKELQESKKDVAKIIEESQKKGLYLKVNSVIEITILE